MTDIDITLTLTDELARKIRDGRIKNLEGFLPSEDEAIYDQMYQESVDAIGARPIGVEDVIRGITRGAAQLQLSEPLMVVGVGVGWVACKGRGRSKGVLIREGTGTDSETLLFAEGLWVPPTPAALRFATAADLSPSDTTITTTPV